MGGDAPIYAGLTAPAPLRYRRQTAPRERHSCKIPFTGGDRNGARATVFRILVKRTLPLLVAAAVVVAAPAASAHPKADDFELSVPNPSAHAARAGGSYTSPKLHAPQALRHRRHALARRRRARRAEVRVKKNGGQWTKWQSVESQSGDAPDPHTGEPTPFNVTAPAWAGQSDWVQFKANRPISSATFHFVEATGATRPVAHASAADKPAIVTRDEWGAQDCKPRTSPAYGKVKAAFIHHTVNLNDYTPAEAPDIVLGICRYHRNATGGTTSATTSSSTVRDDLRGSGGWRRPGRDRRAGAGLQLPDDRHREHRHVHRRAADQVALEAIAKLIRWKLPLSGAPTIGRRRAHERRRQHQPLPGRQRSSPSRACRPPRHRLDRVPRRRALRAAAGAAPDGRQPTAGRGHDRHDEDRRQRDLDRPLLPGRHAAHGQAVSR